MKNQFLPALLRFESSIPFRLSPQISFPEAPSHAPKHPRLACLVPIRCKNDSLSRSGTSKPHLRASASFERHGLEFLFLSFCTSIREGANLREAELVESLCIRRDEFCAIRDRRGAIRGRGPQ